MNAVWSHFASIDLHTAVRLVLPIVPAIAASSPIVGGRANGVMDNRISFYRKNQGNIPSIAGNAIPEAVSSAAEYRQRILERMYADIAPYDPGGLLRHEWLNSRGAIPRFDRSAIEVRLPDSQECPLADMSVLSAIAGAIRAQVEERWIGIKEQASWGSRRLASILDETMRMAEGALIKDADYLGAFGLRAKSVRAGEIWRHLRGEALKAESEVGEALDGVLKAGTLASRILKATGRNPSRGRLRETYGALCRCLSEGRLFIA